MAAATRSKACSIACGNESLHRELLKLLKKAKG